jgi:hypothetical protein
MKRRSTANQQAAGVSLFPFLAVLLCTMGAMIIVLVVIARHNRIKVAEAAQRAADASPDNELAAKREEMEWRISELKESRDATQKLLIDKQTELSHLEEHARRLKDQLEESAAAREHFAEMAAGDARENEELKKRLSRLKVDADRTRAELDKLRRNGGGTGESYAIIPYHGANETHRRPIYVECRKDAIVLQPEGIELKEEDFEFDLGPSNPLVSALRATREHYLRSQLAGKGDAGTPYPLFIIRPDGIEYWEVAQAAISSWGSDFGYELVGQDWNVEFPPADPLLTLALRKAVSEAKYVQMMVARAAPRLAASGGGGTFRAGKGGGIVQVDGGSPTRGRRGSGRPGWASRRGGTGGNGTGGNGTGGNGTGGGGTGGGGLATAAGGPQGNGGTSRGLLANPRLADGDGPVHSVDGDDNPYASALQGTGDRGSGPGNGGQRAGDRPPGIGRAMSADGGRYAAGVPGNGGGSTPPGYGPPGNGNVPGIGGLAQRAGSGFGPQAGSGYGQQPGSQYAQTAARGGGMPQGSPPGSGGAGTSPPGNRLAGTGGNGNAYQNSAPPGVASGYRGQFGPNRQSVGSQASGTGNTAAGTRSNQPPGATGAGTSDLAAAAGQSQAAGGPSVSASPNGFASGTVVENGTIISQSAGGSARSGSPDGQSDDPSATSATAAAPANGRGSVNGRNRLGNSAGSNSNPSSQRLANASQNSSSGSTSSSASSLSSGGRSSPMGGSSSMQSAQANGMPMPMPNFNFGQQDSKPPSESVARHRRAKNWANPDASTTNVPIQRPIRIVCDAEHLTLLPEGRGRHSMRVIQLKPQTAESVDELVASVWDRIDSWGTAGRNMYWRPTLVMEIEPGGQRRYTELQALLADSGLDVHGRPRTRGMVGPRRVGQVR